MAIPVERGVIPEVESLLRVDPVELMKNNPAGLIVNHASYARMDAYFSSQQFDPPHVVRVTTFSDGHQPVTKLLVLDGLTRTKFAADHQGQPSPSGLPWDFQRIPVKDVTDSVLKNPLIAPPEERSGETSLTMLQYLRAVVPPTVEHSQIASDRIAAHLINAWENMVGAELAQKFSAIAGLSLLANRSVPTATNSLLQKFLDTQKPIMVGETVEERVKVQQALRDMAAIIRQSKLFVEQVAESAFELVSARSPVIGGERETRKQVYGLLHLPGVEQKLALSFQRLGEREQKREELGKCMAEAFARISGQPNHKGSMDILIDALQNPNIDFGQTMSVLTTPSPLEQYNEIRQEINKGRLMNACLTASPQGQLSEVGVQLVNQLGTRVYLLEDELPKLVTAITDASVWAKKAHNLIGVLNTERTALMNMGLDPELLGRWFTELSVIQESFLSANTLLGVSQRAREAKTFVQEIIQKISEQQNRSTTTATSPAPEPSIVKIKPHVVTPTLEETPANTPARVESQTFTSPQKTKPVQAQPLIPRSTPADGSQAESTQSRNQRLERATSSYHGMVLAFNLPPNGLSESAKKAIDALLTTIGRVRFGEEDFGSTLRDLFEQASETDSKSTQ